MKKSKFSEQQIIGVLKEVELGGKVGGTAGSMASLSRRTTADVLQVEVGLPWHGGLAAPAAEVLTRNEN